MRVDECRSFQILTCFMWFSNSLDIACACSVFSFAMTVRLLISGLLLTLRSSRASLKSAATSADGNDMMGKCSEMQTMNGGMKRHYLD